MTYDNFVPTFLGVWYLEGLGSAPNHMHLMVY